MAAISIIVIVCLFFWSSSASEVDNKLGMDEIFVINLVRRPERNEYMKHLLEENGVEATFWPATDGQLLTDGGLKKLGVKVLDGYLDPYHKRPMKMGEIGCFLSHYFIWKHILDATNHSKIMILEDDVRFTPGWRLRYSDGMEELNWLNYAEDEKYATNFEERNFWRPDLIYLGRKILSDAEIHSHHNFVISKYSYWTLGYVITRRGIRKLLASDPLTKMMPIDEYLPIMYDSHPNAEWKRRFPIRNLLAISFNPVLITPTHYIGDHGYISDTEASAKLASGPENVESQSASEIVSSATMASSDKTHHPKHNQQSESFEHQPPKEEL